MIGLALVYAPSLNRWVTLQTAADSPGGPQTDRAPRGTAKPRFSLLIERLNYSTPDHWRRRVLYKCRARDDVLASRPVAAPLEAT